MYLDRLYGGSFIDWDAVSASWNKRTVSSRLLLFAARRYAEGGLPADEDRAETLASVSLPDDIKRAYAAPPPAEGERARLWGAFLDAPARAPGRALSGGAGDRLPDGAGPVVHGPPRRPPWYGPPGRPRLPADLEPVYRGPEGLLVTDAR